METLPRFSVSPPYSFASSARPVRRSPSFAETFGQIVRWATGRRRPAPQRERQIVERLVDELAAQIEAGQRQVNSPGVPPPNPIDKKLSITNPLRTPPRRPRKVKA